MPRILCSKSLRTLGIPSSPNSRIASPHAEHSSDACHFRVAMSPQDARRHAQVSPRSKRPKSAKYQRASSPPPCQEDRPRGGFKPVDKDLGAHGQRVQDGTHGTRLKRQASIEKTKPGSPRDKSDTLLGEKDPNVLGYNDAGIVPSESGNVVVAVRVSGWVR